VNLSLKPLYTYSQIFEDELEKFRMYTEFVDNIRVHNTAKV